ncbi:MAG: glycosyltransferase family 39 protein [Candidatus Shapirobacteria bacterium]|nr:glycosyltransferase family 39 protein [Candidatus Shapirobacteria bacterium]
MKLSKLNVGLIVLLAASLFIRLIKINNLSLFGDEIDVGYQAFSLLQTGRDYKGNFLPTYIQSLSESRAPFLIYLTVPTIKIFGLNSLGVRLPPILFGVLSIYLFYKLIFLLSKSSTLALYSSGALSFMPWHFHYSRSAFEVTLLLSIVLAAIYFTLKFIETSGQKYLYSAVILFCLSFYTYNTANIFVPLIILFLFFSNFKKITAKINLKNFLISLTIFICLTLPLIYQIFFGTAANRFNLISIFHDQTLIDNIINKRTSYSSSTQLVEKIFHNKPIVWGKTFIQNYLNSFSLPFIFNSGDQINIRHSIPSFGLVFLVFLPLIIKGLFSLNLKEKLHRLMFFWFLISPLAASLTINGGTHATRLFLMTIPLAFFAGFGLTEILNQPRIPSKIFISLLFLGFIFEICAYSHEYFVHYPKDFPKPWNFGYQELFSNIPNNSSNRIFISNSNFNSLLPYLFYQKISPQTLPPINDIESRKIISDMSGFKLTDKIYFINNWYHNNEIFNRVNEIAQPGDTFVLFQLNEIPGDMNLSQQSPLVNYQVLKVVKNPNGSILGQIIQKQ